MDKKTRIAIFFSLGTGLSLWQEKGLLSRYMPYFKRLLEDFDELYLFTYDRQELSCFSEPKIHVGPVPLRLPNVLYSLIMPFLYLDKLKKVSLFSTIQMSGVIPALLAKILLRKPLLDFLGFTFIKALKQGSRDKRTTYFYPSGKAENAIRRKIRQVADYRRHIKVEHIVKELTFVLRGWVNYFRITNSTRKFGKIKFYTAQRIRKFMRRHIGKVD